MSDRFVRGAVLVLAVLAVAPRARADDDALVTNVVVTQTAITFNGANLLREPCRPKAYGSSPQRLIASFAGTVLGPPSSVSDTTATFPLVAPPPPGSSLWTLRCENPRSREAQEIECHPGHATACGWASASGGSTGGGGATWYPGVPITLPLTGFDSMTPKPLATVTVPSGTFVLLGKVSFMNPAGFNQQVACSIVGPAPLAPIDESGGAVHGPLTGATGELELTLEGVATGPATFTLSCFLPGDPAPAIDITSLSFGALAVTVAAASTP